MECKTFAAVFVCALVVDPAPSGYSSRRSSGPPCSSSSARPYAAETELTYAFEYVVNDEPTNDVNSESESADGNGNVGRSHSQIEPDGARRIVEYTADRNGFNAVVNNGGTPASRRPRSYAAPGPPPH